MEVESSNYIEAIESSDSEQAKETEARPIMRLFKNLIDNDNKQNTMLTNAQLIEILQKEFDMDVAMLHELEVDIYLSVIKKFLLHWPQWDEFDRQISRLKNMKAEDRIQKVLEQKQGKLKAYLQVMLEAAKSKAKNLVKTVEESSNEASTSENKDKSKKSENEVVMEVYCNRSQLNNLVRRSPLHKTNKGIFNTGNFAPGTISLTKYDMNTILKYWNVKISINLKFLSFTYTFNQNLRHTLVNKIHTKHAYEKTELNTNLQMKSDKKTKKHVDPKEIYNILYKLSFEKTKHTSRCLDVLGTILNPDAWGSDTIDIPGKYRKYVSKYPYVRYLNSSSKADEKFDLRIEEVASPMQYFIFNNVDSYETVPKDQKCLKVECFTCSVAGEEIDAESLLHHFNEYHFGEKAWKCTNCNKQFNVTELGVNGWYHDC